MTATIEKLTNKAEKLLGGLSSIEREVIAEAMQFLDPNLAEIRRQKAVAQAAGGQSPPAERTVNALLIRWLLLSSEAKEAIDPGGLRIEDCHIKGRLDLGGATLSRRLGLVRCRLADDLILNDTEIQTLNLEGTHCKCIHASRAKVKGAVLLRNGFQAQGEVEFINATVGGDFDAANASFLNRGGTALDLGRCKVQGAIILCTRPDPQAKVPQRFRAEGQVRLIGVSAGGDLECSNGVFDDSPPDNYDPGRTAVEPVAMNLDQANVEGSIFLRRGFEARGAVRMLGVSVGGEVDCRSGVFLNAGRGVLIADRARVSGSLLLDTHRETPTPPRSNGVFSIVAAQIGGSLQCRGLFFEGDCETGLQLAHSTVTGAFQWVEIHLAGNTMINLSHAKVGPFEDDSSSWSLGDGGQGKVARINLDGFVYDSLQSRPPTNQSRPPTNREDREPRLRDRCKWLELQPPEKFSLQPYEQLATVLRRLGYEDEAKAILVAQRDRQRRLGKLSKLDTVVSLMKKWTIGYGHYPLRVFPYIIVLTLVGAVVFWFSHANSLLMATKKPEELPAFVPLAYSLDVLIPAISLRQKEFWEPAGQPGLGWAVVGYYCFHVVAGWYLTLMFVAGMSGLIRK